ncbi:zinc fingers and homeoboxes protein 2-like [Syngnathoides biaculeatus]|uniref:zinc fingers and homeoboxes protein 2-like n=1 Tax=Syngnathoides biaculeatus TaxID=300417 RepID=UPI002ADDB7EF|nr:zinc fingers and homeoboxes protein 2-like [Syngnathoides biaculeatus]XP_061676468.1 zinc fingers and homeoboxes protein 2-like [Syngnathoides biaculeatus]XP_061676469.1 zinc fingers and homeoboxes protein 2-like [Syngnathoides biaculeatus]XP_061676470.1 zinc fingers and homeoboxes protein 2-like [Syngnathoides biaculeatus]XP_061676471.1 zinc fingers and homeoboxes protein 2-like [Syngnathoides biaculeatus]XP_061676472.1 zinc fingers and homeoboxes protein 2-like [Syngnathoides biaculeatus]
MSSRRKASTPCMIRPQETMVELDDNEETTENHTEKDAMETDPSVDLDLTGKTSDSSAAPDIPTSESSDSSKPSCKQQRGYECKYCTFSTQNLNTFKEHVDANHPNVILNPLYLCAVCNFNTKKFDSLTEHNDRNHPGESNFKFKRIKMNNQTILEQTIEGSSNNAVIYNSSGAVSSKAEGQGTVPQGKATAFKIGKQKAISSDNKRTEPHLCKLNPDLTKKAITALNVNGTVIIPESTLLKADGLSHIMPSLQRPVNYTQVPKIAIPLNTTKYNPSLDDNLTLISSFNKFPYPTQAELSWLTAVSKHPEEQIKVWFTTQRLKQGITWSPEEVEEARKKMFNGTISSVPQTFTVVTPHLTTQSSANPSSVTTTVSKSVQPAASVLQSVPCQLVGQTSLVLTPVANGSTVTCAPLALTLANQVAQSLKRPLASPSTASENKRPSIIQAISAPIATSKMASPKVLNFTADPNKTAEQLSVLRSSYMQCPFPEEEEIYRLIETTGLSRGEIKKWFSEQRLLNLKGVPPPPLLVKADVTPVTKDGPVRKAVPSHFPLLERVKGKSSEQLNALEESFQRSSSPTDTQLDQLAQETRLSKTEVDCWFSERRALRDNMEKALLSVTKNTDDKGDRPGVLLNGSSHREHDGKILQSSALPQFLSSSSSSSSSPPMLAASSPHPPTLSVSASPPILNSSSSSSSPHPPILSVSTSPAHIPSGSLTLLREMFCRTQWPTPEEYSQLEGQTSLGRTDIVRWFKEHRSALKNGETLDWLEPYQSQKEQQKSGQEQKMDDSDRQQQSVPMEGKVEEKIAEAASTENSKMSNPDAVQWLTEKLTHSVSDLGQATSNIAEQGRWVQVTVAVGEDSETGLQRQRLAADADVLTLEQPGRVTG